MHNKIILRPAAGIVIAAALLTSGCSAVLRNPAAYLPKASVSASQETSATETASPVSSSKVAMTFSPTVLFIFPP